MVCVYTLFFFASESGLQHHTQDRGAEINSEEIEDEDDDSEDDQENFHQLLLVLRLDRNPILNQSASLFLG